MLRLAHRADNRAISVMDCRNVANHCGNLKIERRENERTNEGTLVFPGANVLAETHRVANIGAATGAPDPVGERDASDATATGDKGRDVLGGAHDDGEHNGIACRFLS
jgi:hypothetical protein